MREKIFLDLAFLEQGREKGRRNSADRQSNGRGMDRLSFDVSDVQEEARLIGAELRLFANGSLPATEKSGILKIHLSLSDTG